MSQLFVEDRKALLSALVNYNLQDMPVKFKSTKIVYETQEQYKSMFNVDIPISKIFEIDEGIRKLTIDDIVDLNGNNKYPLIAGGCDNNGVIGYINTFTHDCEEMGSPSGFICVSTSFMNSCCRCTVQRGKFAASATVIVLKLRNEWKILEQVLPYLALMLQIELKLRFAQFDRKSLMNTILHSVPFKMNSDHKMVCDIEGLKYIYYCAIEGDSSSKNMYPVSFTPYYHIYFESPIGVMMKEVRIDELFEYYSKGKIKSLANCSDGQYPCISCSAVNNGIAKYINTHDYDTEKLGFPLLTVPGNGDIYKCFVQTGKFSAQTSVHLLKLKDERLNKYIGTLSFIMSLRFGDGTYEYHKGILNKERLMNETIELPVVVRGLSESEMKDLVDGLISIDELTNNGTSDKYTYEINENLLNNYIYTRLM